MKKVFSLKTMEDWRPCVDQLLKILKPGLILALSGPLGAGKTTLVQQVAAAYGSTTLAKSPTFALMRAYPLSHPVLHRLLHVDAYRLEKEADIQVLNLEEELLVPGTILAIEWPEHVPVWLAQRAEQLIWLRIETRDDDMRDVTLEYAD